MNQRSSRDFAEKPISVARFFEAKESSEEKEKDLDDSKSRHFTAWTSYRIGRVLVSVAAVLIMGALPGQAAAQGASVSDLRLLEASPEKQTAILQDPRSQQELELRTNDIIGDFQVVLIEVDAITLQGPDASEPLVLRLSRTPAKSPKNTGESDKPASPSPSQRTEPEPTENTRAEAEPRPTPPVKAKETSLEVKNPYAPRAESPKDDKATKSATKAKELQFKTASEIVDPEAPIVENHRVTRRQLDAALSDFQKLEKQIKITPTGEEIVVDFVKAKSLPFRLGIRKGDRIQTVAGAKLTSTQAAADAYVSLSSAKAFDITLLRGKTPVTLRCIVK